MIERITLRFENGEINNLTEEMESHIEDARRSLLGHYTGKGVPESRFASRMSMDADVLVWQGFRASS